VIAALTPEAQVLQQIVDFLLRIGLPVVLVQRFESEMVATNRSADDLRQVYETLQRVQS
jgi:hypothetical protein